MPNTTHAQHAKLRTTKGSVSDVTRNPAGGLTSAGIAQTQGTGDAKRDVAPGVLKHHGATSAPTTCHGGRGRSRREHMNSYRIDIVDGPCEGSFFYWDCGQRWHGIQKAGLMKPVEHVFHGVDAAAQIPELFVHGINPVDRTATYVPDNKLLAVEDISKPNWIVRLIWQCMCMKVAKKRLKEEKKASTGQTLEWKTRAEWKRDQKRSD